MGVYPNANTVTLRMVSFIMKRFNTDEAAAKVITTSEFMFPKHKTAKLGKEKFYLYMRRGIYHWHEKARAIMGPAYVARLVMDGEFGHMEEVDGVSTPRLSQVNARTMLAGGKFYKDDSSQSAIKAAALAFIATLSDQGQLFVKSSEDVPEAHLRLLAPHWGWFTSKVSGMARTVVCLFVSICGWGARVGVG